MGIRRRSDGSDGYEGGRVGERILGMAIGESCFKVGLKGEG